MYFKCGFFKMANLNTILKKVATRLKYRVVYKSVEETSQRAGIRARGLCDWFRKEIWLTNPKTTGTFVHELIHAIQDVYGDKEPISSNRAVIKGCDPGWSSRPIEQEAVYYQRNKKEFIKLLRSLDLISDKEMKDLKSAFLKAEVKKNILTYSSYLGYGFAAIIGIMILFPISFPEPKPKDIPPSNCSIEQFDMGDC